MPPARSGPSLHPITVCNTSLDFERRYKRKKVGECHAVVGYIKRFDGGFLLQSGYTEGRYTDVGAASPEEAYTRRENIIVR